MKIKTILLLVLLSMTVACIVFFSLRGTERKDIVSLNVEALTSSESYALDDCIVKSSVGLLLIIDRFCEKETDDYTLFGCSYSCGYESSLRKKCVKE